MEKINTYNGDNVYKIITDKYGERLSNALREFRKTMEDKYGTLQMITEPYEEDNGEVGLAVFISGGGIMSFLRIRQLENGEIVIGDY